MDKRFLVYLGVNGSVNVIPEDRVPPVGSSVLLVLVFALALSLNVFLIASLSTRVLSRVAFNVLLLHLALVGALDSVSVLGSLVVILHSSPGTLFCRLDAMVSQLTTVLVSWLMATMSAERAVATTSEAMDDGEDRGAALCQTLKRILPALWVYAIVLILPISFAVPAADLLVFTDKYSCGFAQPGESVLYPSLLLLLGHGIPFVVSATSVTSMAQHVTATRSHQKKLALAAEHRRVLTLTGSTLPRGGFGVKKISSAEEDKFNAILIVILVLYVILLLPHIVSVSISQLSPAPHKRHDFDDSSSASVEVASTSTGLYDMFFIWSRYTANILVPLVLFLIHKEVRKKCETLFCCYCHVENAVHFEDDILATSEKPDVEDKKKKKKRDRKAKVVANHRTPVLYATSEGLHLRVYDGDDDVGGDGGAETLSWPSGSRRTQASLGLKYRCEFCDLTDFTTPVTQTFAPHRPQVIPVPISNASTALDQESPQKVSTKDKERPQGQVNHNRVFRRRSDGAIADAVANQNNKKVVRFGPAQSMKDTFTVKRSGNWDLNAGRNEGGVSSR